MNSEVWINGHYLGKKAYGYISFQYDIGQYLTAGTNHIAVRVDNLKEPSARWYHPAGIYAPVSLTVMDAQSYVQNNGVYVTTSINKDKSAQATVKLEYANTRNESLYVESKIVDQTGRPVLVENNPLPACTSENCSTTSQLTLYKPKLWDTETPNLYTLSTTIRSADNVYDTVDTRFGIRTIKWDTKTGFWLNDKVTKLKGVSEHWEGGPVGGAWTKPLLRWKLALFKEMGVNAIRTAHNPYPPIFYELCDEMGILVMDEVFDGWSKRHRLTMVSRRLKTIGKQI
ncbi:glycoside hydrolase family 2 protein [Psychrosphaera algicola]|uniref:Glycoside hydrolase family 2 TIM barrel-domain containing protein n=1 Tax=Psychrosphaera algicola TaxID=3023714 RepID=A0ABT5FCE1_9GAMM|nr:glycoside hydrolase family 2 TIM barrel-domain containing protein [Psychrosphaera sp. G1-22]MDC2888814.1 glycoside hydrolase family 2 TIM barrel-domain containing protein [Psychrosphaera sp. G1-22]